MKSELAQQRSISIAFAETEWLTLGLVAANWLIFLGLTVSYQSLPWWLILPVGGYLIAFFGSLQHEILHGHPTSSQWLNEAIIFPNITLWMPYSLYKATHLTHHINHQLTDPALDPESYYHSAKKWQHYPAWKKTYFHFYNTFVGRCLFGPIHIITTLWTSEARSMLSGNTQATRTWIIHILSCLPVLYWIIVICNISFWEYLLLFVYPGLALTLLRSFVEHQAVENLQQRSIIVETNALLSLMYLNNNLHAIHHKDPKLAWFHLPKAWQNNKAEVLASNGGYYFKGYFSIINRYWKTPKEQPDFPL